MVSRSCEAESGEKALELLDQFAFDIVITDLRLPGIDGTQVIEAALAGIPASSAIVITGYGTVKDAVDAIKQGASDFVAKPFQFDELMHVLQKALEQRRLARRTRTCGRNSRSAINSAGSSAAAGRCRALPAARDRGALEQHDPDHRRDRNRQGGGRAGHPPQQPAASAPVRRIELQRDSGDAARGRAVRPRARRVHRRRRRPAGPLRAGAQGHAVPRRSRDDEHRRCR